MENAPRRWVDRVRHGFSLAESAPQVCRDPPSPFCAGDRAWAVAPEWHDARVEDGSAEWHELNRHRWRFWPRRRRQRVFWKTMPNRPTLLSAETSRYGLAIRQLDDGTLELAIIDWDRRSGDDTTFDTVAEAQLAAEKVTGVTSIVWWSPPSPPGDASA
jgi:hypothetical protein